MYNSIKTLKTNTIGALNMLGQSRLFISCSARWRDPFIICLFFMFGNFRFGQARESTLFVCVHVWSVWGPNGACAKAQLSHYQTHLQNAGMSSYCRSIHSQRSTGATLTPLGPVRAMMRGRGLVKLWCMPMPSRWGPCCYLCIDAIRMESVSCKIYLSWHCCCCCGLSLRNVWMSG